MCVLQTLVDQIILLIYVLAERFIEFCGRFGSIEGSFKVLPGWSQHYILTGQVSENNDSPKDLSFGWQRAQLLGAFFNGVLLLGLGISIFLQSIERFIALHRESPVARSTLRTAD